MVEVTVLPTRTDPKQVTAKHLPKNLEDHMMGFLAKNHQKGFVGGEDDIIDMELFDVDLKKVSVLDIATIAEVMMILAQFDYVPHRLFKQYASRISKLSNKKIKLSGAIELLSRMFGYRNHSCLCFHMYKRVSKAKRDWMKKNKVEVLVQNRRDRRSISLHIFHEAEFVMPETWERDMNKITSELKEIQNQKRSTK
jgi:hypothetical protein